MTLQVLPTGTPVTEPPSPSLPYHPDYSCDSNITWVEGVDADYPELGGKFLIPSQRVKQAKDEDGKTVNVYCFSSSIVKAISSDGRHAVYFTSKKAAELDGWKFSFRTNRMMKETDPEFYGHETILSYHTHGARADYSNENDDWKVGIEVEKEDFNHQNDKNVWRLFSETGWAKETDSSLGSGGFELVSPILPLHDISRLKQACKPVKKYLDAQYSNRCGGHINLSCKGMSSDEVLEKLKPAIGLLYAIYKNRMENYYCKAKHFTDMKDYPDKYSAFYKKNSNVLEIRLFPAVKNYTNLLWRIQLVRWLIKLHPNVADKVLSLKDKNSFLYVHLSKIYSQQRIDEIIADTVRFHSLYVGRLSAKEREKLATNEENNVS